MRTAWEKLQAGDFILIPNGDKAKVLGVCDDIFFRSEWQRFTVASRDVMSIQEAKEKGWLVMRENGPIPMHQEEIEKLLGHAIKFIPKQKKK